MRATATVGADIDSVVAWWRDPRRDGDLRAFLEKSGAQEVTIERSETVDRRIRDVHFKTAAGAEIWQRLQTEAGPAGTAFPTGDGYVTRSTHEDRILQPSGREVTCACSVLMEFTRDDHASTRIVETHDQRMTGVRWWERFLPPNAQRVRLNQRLRDWAELCRIDLGV